jgi:hypothetical protein
MVHNGMRRRWLILVICSPVLLIAAFLGCFYAFEASLWDDRGFKDFCGETEVVQSGLQQFFRIRHDYPAYSMEQLRTMGAIADEMPSEYWVHYTPFSSSTLDDTVVLRMGYGPFGFVPWLCDSSWTKYDLTHDSASDGNRWADRLEETKEKKVQTIEHEHPSWKIVAALASLVGPAPNPDHAELLIDYRIPGDPVRYRAIYDFAQEGDSWAWDGKTKVFNNLR